MANGEPRVQGGVWAISPRQGQQNRHLHRGEIEFNLVVRGTGRYLLDDRRYDLGPLSLVWLFPGQAHILVDHSADCELWLGFITVGALRRAQCAHRCATLLEPDPAGHFCRRLADADAKELGRVLDSVSRSREDPARFVAGIAYATMTAWAMHLRAPADAASVLVHPGVQRAARLLALDGPADLASIAARSGIGRSRLCQLFRRQIGQSVGAYRARQRLERFFAASADPRRTLLAAALDAGFGSYAQFHRVFRRHVGVSPAEWARKRSAVEAGSG